MLKPLKTAPRDGREILLYDSRVDVIYTDKWKWWRLSWKANMNGVRLNPDGWYAARANPLDGNSRRPRIKLRDSEDME